MSDQAANQVAAQLQANDGKKNGGKKKADSPADTYFHLYYCPSYECLVSDNPARGSMHQRGVNSSSAKPLAKGPKCPGCGGEMKIARNGFVDAVDKTGKPTGGKVPHVKGHVTTDAQGNAVMHGDPILYKHPGQEPEDDKIAAEWAAAVEDQA